MTISSEVRKAGPYNGNGVTTSFPFSFKVFEQADVTVTKASTLGVESVLVLDTNYTVTLNADQDANPGGSVSVTPAPATGEKLVITTSVANLQPVELTNAGGFYPEVLNDALDRATIQVQQLAEEVARSLKIGVTSSEDASPDALVAELQAAVDAASSAETAAAGSASAAAASAVAAATFDPALYVPRAGGVNITGFLNFYTGAGGISGQPSLMVNLPPSGVTGSSYAPVFKNSQTNGNTFVGATPNGTATESGFYAQGGTLSVRWGGFSVNSTTFDIHSSCSDGSTSPHAVTFKFNNVAKASINNDGSISSYGLKMREGASGGTLSAITNFYWTGAAMQCWINTSNVGTVTITSDYRIKRDVRPMVQTALDRIAALKPVLYRYADNEQFNHKAEDREREGFIAHELAEVIPSAVEGEKDAPNQIQSLRVDAVIAVLVKAVQELSARVKELERKC